MEKQELLYPFREPKMDHRVSRLWGVPWNLTDNKEDLEHAVLGVIEDLDLRVFDKLGWRFQPYGLTLIEGLYTSHLAVHTWPENSYPSVEERELRGNRGYIHVDTVVCGGVMLDELHDSLLKRFSPLRIITEEITLVNPNRDHLPGTVATVRRIQDTFNYILPQSILGHYLGD